MEKSKKNKSISKQHPSTNNSNLDLPHPKLPRTIIKKGDPKSGKVIVNDRIMPQPALILIMQFFICNYQNLFKCLLVNKQWNKVLQNKFTDNVWLKLGGKGTGLELRKDVKARAMARYKKSVQEYLVRYNKLFDYGSTKQNLANKIVKKLNLQISYSVNKINRQKVNYKMRQFNFSSYTSIKITQISNLGFKFNQKIILELKIFSKKFRRQVKLSRVYRCQQILKDGISCKAFNYYVQRNSIITYFEGDKSFLYLLFNISAIQIINLFKQKLGSELQNTTVCTNNKNKNKNKNKNNYHHQTFIQYLKYQSDFQLHFSIHTDQKTIFHYSNTKLYPHEFNQLQALFIIQLKQKMGNIQKFRLDNKLGIQQVVQNLLLMDLVLKDRDNFIICFSGFISLFKVQQDEIKLNFEYQQQTMKQIRHSQSNYAFSILVQQRKKCWYVQGMKLRIKKYN